MHIARIFLFNMILTTILLIVCIILFCCSLYFLQKSKSIKIQKQIEQQKILHEISDLKQQESNILISIVKSKQQQEQINDNIKEKYAEKANLIEDIQDQQNKVQLYYNKGKQDADKQLDLYRSIIEDQKKKDQAEYEAGRAQLEESLTLVRAELDKLKATRAAAQESFLREEKIREEKDFYTLHLTDKAIHDIRILKTVEEDLIDPRPLRMAIWSSCYSKRVNELCDRIFGTNKKSGIYKITYLPTNQCYVGQARDLKDRIREHCKAGFARIDTPANNKLYEKMASANTDDFTFELLEQCPIQELNDKEKYYIELYSAYNFGMNSNRGIGNGI